MKLTPPNPNWAVRRYARHDLSMAESRARGNSARAWAGVYTDGANKIKAVTDNITETRQNAEAQELYNNAMKQIGNLENTLYTEQQIPMDSPLMTGVNYDDTYQYVQNGVTQTANRGFASTHEIGDDIWAVQSSAIAQAFSGQGTSSRVQGIVAGKLQDQLGPKTQNVNRHVLDLAVADKRQTVVSLISESARNGDVKGAIQLADEAYNQGIFNQKEMNESNQKALQDNDLIKFRHALASTEKEGDLSVLADTAIFSTNYMTTPQKVSVANAALGKIDRNRKLQKEQLNAYHEANEVDTIISYHEGQTNVSQLLDESHKYDRAGFTRLYERMTTPTPVISNSVLNNEYSKQIINSPFEANPNNSMDDIHRVIMENMRQSVRLGTLSPDDYNTHVEDLKTTAAAPFKSQQYIQAKKSLFVDILGTLDSGTLAEIEASGPNITAIKLQAMGQKGNVSVLGIRAYEDLNTYMRTFGYQADPIQWWSDNKDAYKVENYVKESANRYADQYPADTVRLSNGQVDIRSTEDNLVKQYNDGMFGVTGTLDAMRELNARAAALKGEDL